MTALFLELVSTSISASWVILAVLLLRFVLKKAPRWVMVALWGLVAVRLLCPVSIESGLSLIPERVGSGELVSEWADDYVGDVSHITEDSIYYDAAVTAGRKPVADENGRFYVVTKYDQLGEPDTVENTVVPVLAAVWLAGAAGMALYTAVSYVRLKRRVFMAVRLRENIYQSENVASPFVLGLFAPKIYLPFAMEEGAMAHVIAHEQAHIRRRDHWWKPLGFLLLTIHWFNPLMWLAYILLCRDIELACDEKVIRELGRDDRADYSRALLICAADRRMIAACPLAFGEVGVKERVKSVLAYKKPAFWLVVLAVTACAVAGVCFLTDPAGIKLEDITAQKGYAITEQRDTELTLTIPVRALPDSVYLPGGHEFDPGEVVVYEDGTTTIWLEQVLPNPEEEEDWPRFFFNCSYDLPESARILLPYRMTAEGYYQMGGFLCSEVLRVDGKDYGEAVSECAIGGGGSFACYLSEKACRAAQDELEIEIYLNELTYEKLPRGLYGGFGRITGYGYKGGTSLENADEYFIRIEETELKCTLEQYEQARGFMQLLLEDEVDDCPVYVRYTKPFSFANWRGELVEIKFATDLSFSPTDLGDAVIGGAETTVPIITSPDPVGIGLAKPGLTLDEAGEGDDEVSLESYPDMEDWEGSYVLLTVRLGTGEELTHRWDATRAYADLSTARLIDPDRDCIVVELNDATSNYAASTTCVFEVVDGQLVERLRFDGVIGTHVEGDTLRLAQLVNKWLQPEYYTARWNGRSFDLTPDGYVLENYFLSEYGASGGQEELTLCLTITTGEDLLPVEKIQLLRGEEIIQTLDSADYGSFYANSYSTMVPIQFNDVNFDGYPDFGILCDQSAAAHHCWFRWDPDAVCFRYFATLAMDLTADETVWQLRETLGTQTNYYCVSQNGTLVPLHAPTAEPDPRFTVQSAAFQAVLRGSAAIRDGAGERKITYTAEGNTFAPAYFSVVDMDRDGTAEVVLWMTVGGNPYAGFDILRWEAGEVVCYSQVYRGLQGLKQNATFTYSSGASDNGIALCTEFKDGQMYSLPLSWCQGTAYYAANAPATAEQFYAALSRQSLQPDVVWYELTGDNIARIPNFLAAA